MKQICRCPSKLVLAGVTLLTLTTGGYGQLLPGKTVGKTNMSSFMGTNGVLTQLPTPPQPGISIAQTDTNEVTVTITNAASYANYELYGRTLLDTAHPWTLRIIGTQGQSNFVTEMDTSLKFFEVAVGSDFDADGIPNYEDGDPLNASVGILSGTIDSPAQGAIITQ